jgi:hypothetical protein
LDDRAADRKDVSGIDVTKLPFRPKTFRINSQPLDTNYHPPKQHI